MACARPRSPPAGAAKLRAPALRPSVRGAWGLRQAINARHEHALNGVRHRYVGLPRRRVEHGAGQLFEEEGIALRFVDNHLLQRRRQRVVLPGRAHHGHALLRGQMAQRHLGGIRLVEPRRAIARTIRESAARSRRLQHSRPAMPGSPLRCGPPVQVLNLEDQGRC